MITLTLSWHHLPDGESWRKQAMTVAFKLGGLIFSGIAWIRFKSRDNWYS